MSEDLPGAPIVGEETTTGVLSHEKTPGHTGGT